jgi:ribosomal protein L7/L12
MKIIFQDTTEVINFLNSVRVNGVPSSLRDASFEIKIPNDGKFPPISSVARDFALQGDKTRAIKTYREQTGCDLLYAKNVIECAFFG